MTVVKKCRVHADGIQNKELPKRKGHFHTANFSSGLIEGRCWAFYLTLFLVQQQHSDMLSQAHEILMD